MKSEVRGPSVFYRFFRKNKVEKLDASFKLASSYANIIIFFTDVYSADKSADTVSKLQNPQLNIIAWQMQISQILLDFQSFSIGRFFICKHQFVVNTITFCA
jgi:hypothetical protein